MAETIELFVDGIRSSTRPEDRKTASDYLASLAPLLASAVLGRDILRELPAMDRIFGHTWLVDAEPFRPAMKKWRTFVDEYETFVLSGMTAIERLGALGILDAFHRAQRAGDRAEMERLLVRARVDVASIRSILAGDRDTSE